MVGLIIFISDGSPILYKQKRFGQNNKIFELYKFRTMRLNTPILPTENFNDTKKYLIPLGSFIRKWSIDELPQFINIIKGDLNFIGPRPSLTKNEKKINELRSEMGIIMIKPGITGWAQINGRDELTINEKVKYDTYYFEHQSFILDLKIFFLTFKKILLRSNIKH